MTTLIYFRPFSSSQRLFRMQAKSRSPRCFRQRPPPSTCMRSNRPLSHPPNQTKPSSEGAHNISTCGLIYTWSVFSFHRHPHLPPRLGHTRNPPNPPTSERSVVPSRLCQDDPQPRPEVSPETRPVLSLSSPLTFSRDLSLQMLSGRNKQALTLLSLVLLYYMW